VAVVALSAAVLLGVGPCPPVKCNSACRSLLDRCAIACPPAVGGVVGYEGAKSFCEDNPDTAGCSNLPTF
jgi:hypothetical protein